MALSGIPVVLPYRIGGEEGPLHSLHIETVASSPEAALATARVAVRALAVLRHGTVPEAIFEDRVRIGAAEHTVTGPYAYILGKTNRVPHLALPARIEKVTSEELGQSLAGIDPRTTYGLVMDCAPMTYLDSAGLSTLAEASQRLRLQLCRLPPPILKVVEMVRMQTVLNIHPDMRSAFEGLIKRLGR